MLHQILFLALFLGLLPTILISPFVGVLAYYWIDYLPPYDVYALTLLPSYLSFSIGALTFYAWLVREKKTLPRPFLIMALMIALLVWVNITWFYALAPRDGAYEWNRTIKVIGFAILTAQMLSTRARLEAFVWALVLAATYFAVPSAIKVIFSGGSGGIGEGEVVTGAWNSFFGDRNTLAVVLAMSLPFVLYLGRRTILLPVRWGRWMRPAKFGLAAGFLLAIIGTFSRGGLLAGGATMLMLAVRSRRKVAAILGITAAVLALLLIAPANWFLRMDTITDYQSDYSAMTRIAAWKWAWQMALSHPIVGGGFGVFVLDAGSIPGKPGWLEAHSIFFQMMAEHGFVGFGLFCLLIVAIYCSCAVVQRRVRANDELAWCADLARATQIGLVAFVVGGSFLSIALNPFLFILAGIAVGTRTLVEGELRAAVRNKTLLASGAIVAPAE